MKLINNFLQKKLENVIYESTLTFYNFFVYLKNTNNLLIKDINDYESFMNLINELKKEKKI